jgi:hypothetical protein
VFFTVLFLDALKGKEKTSEFNTKVLMTWPNELPRAATSKRNRETQMTQKGLGSVR